jgi:hypothetical protein
MIKAWSQGHANSVLVIMGVVMIGLYSGCSRQNEVSETTSSIAADDSGDNDASGSSDASELITPSTPPDSDVHFTINSREGGHEISRFIYGLNGNDFNSRPYNLTLTRFGGNRLTAYNWETNASNAGTDWYNQNDSYLGGGDTPGGAVTPDIDAAAEENAGCIVGIPVLGYVAADKNGGGDVNQTADYLTQRFYPSYPRKGSAFQLSPDLTDDAVYQDEWVYFLQQSYPDAFADTTAPIFLQLDNEPGLWATTHPRLRNDATGSSGDGVTYAELIEKTIDYADAVKDVEPDALVFGPVSYGWQGMVNLQDASDANGRDFLDFYLQALSDAEESYGRLLDVLDIHWYPEAQGGGVRITGDSSADAVAEARIQAPRSLWDSTYTEDSWITTWSTMGPIELIPRMQEKIDTRYPGTRLAISEYYYGGGDHISGGIAEADVLGIFGREDVFAAVLWTIGSTDHRFIFGGFDMFRNYDGANASFGDISIQAENSDAVDTSVYASVDSEDEERIVMVCINKTDEEKTAGISVTHTQQFTSAEVYVLTDSDSNPRYSGVITISQINAFQYTMPAMSVTTLELNP